MIKHSFTKLSVLLLVLHLSSNLFAQDSKFDFNQLAKRNDTQQIASFNINEQITAADVKYLPTLATSYYWDTLTKSYRGGNVEAMKYNSLGKIISKTSYYPNSIDSSYKYLYNYYPNEAGQEELSLNWINGGWQNSRKEVKVLDSYGNETESTNYSWQDITSEWKISTGNKRIYKYDNQGRKVEDLFIWYKDGIYANQSKVVYTYSTNTDKGMNTLTIYNWENNTWVYDRKFTDIVWKDYDNVEYISFSQQSYINNELVDSSKIMRTYIGNNFIELMESYINGKWINKYKQTFSIDKEGNSTNITQEYDTNAKLTNTSKHVKFVDVRGNDAGNADYKLVNNAWVLQYSFSSANTYNVNGSLVETISENYSSSYGSSKFKIVYSDFVTITTGVAERSVADILSVFPIPAKDFINISPLVYESLTYKIYNRQGTEILTDFSANKIDVSQWTTGIYFLHIRTAEGNNYTKKLIKE